MVNYTITSKNITDKMAKEIFSEDMKKVLKILAEFRNKNIDNLDYSQAIRGYNFLEGLLEKKLSKKEISLWSHLTHNKTLEEAYHEYIERYNYSKIKIDEILKILENNKNSEMYCKECPITKRKFNIMTGKDIEDKIKNYHLSTSGSYPFQRSSRGEFMIIDKKYGDSDELKLKERFHPDVTNKIKKTWDFEKDININENIKDGTVLKFCSLLGSVQVAYNPYNHINGLNLQFVKLYPTTKGLYYKIRGKKRVYIELPDIEVELGD